MMAMKSQVRAMLFSKFALPFFTHPIPRNSAMRDRLSRVNFAVICAAADDSQFFHGRKAALGTGDFRVRIVDTEIEAILRNSNFIERP